MARLVEIGVDPPRSLSLQPGDMLNVSASGGLVESGEGVVEAIGPFVPATIGLDGRLIGPETPPTNFLFLAVRPGRARLAVFSGGLVPTARASIDILVAAATDPPATVPK